MAKQITEHKVRSLTGKASRYRITESNPQVMERYVFEVGHGSELTPRLGRVVEHEDAPVGIRQSSVRYEALSELFVDRYYATTTTLGYVSTDGDSWGLSIGEVSPHER